MLIRTVTGRFLHLRRRNAVKRRQEGGGEMETNAGKQVLREKKSQTYVSMGVNEWV